MSDLGFGNVSSSLNSGGSIDEEKQKTKKLLIMIVAAMFILGIVAVVLLVLISKGEKPKLSMNIDGAYVHQPKYTMNMIVRQMHGTSLLKI